MVKEVVKEEKVRRVMLTSPLKGKLPSFYYKNVLQYGMNRIKGAKLFYSLLEGPAIQMARNQIVQYARKQNVDELVMIDVDVDVPFEAFKRLMSHEDEEIVCGLYSRRTMDTHWHVHPLNDKEVENEKGLLRVYQSAIGLCKIKMSVFDKLEEAYPDRVGDLVEGGAAGEKVAEFFPMELMGKNTPGGRILAIKELLKMRGDDETDPAALLARIAEETTKRHPESNQFIGEDYGFCCLARNAGIPIYLDTRLVLKHEGTAMFPIDTAQLMKMLDEPWRKDEVEELRKSYWPEDFISEALPRDHCLDVLKGCYDVPIEFPDTGYTPTILDIGANVGAFCRWASDRWPNVKTNVSIHAYEPALPNFKLLDRTCAEIIKNNVFIYRHMKAVGDSEAVVPLYSRSPNCGNYSLSNMHLPKAPLVANVDVVDAAELPEADIVKIDTEGSELMIVKRLTLTPRLKAIVLEYHSYSDIEPITTYLVGNGFTAFEYSPSSEHRGILKFLRK